MQAGTGSVELKRYPASHPFAQLQGSDNIIAFTTARYRCRQPRVWSLLATMRHSPS